MVSFIKINWPLLFSDCRSLLVIVGPCKSLYQSLWVVASHFGSLCGFVGCCGSLWVVVDHCVGHCGSLWVVAGHCGSLWVVAGRCGSLWVVAGCCGSFLTLVCTEDGYHCKHLLDC